MCRSHLISSTVLNRDSEQLQPVLGVAVDVFGLGQSSAGVALLEPLGRSTGGSTTIHYSVNATMLASSLHAALWGTFGTNGLVDVRLSQGLQLVSVIGNVR